MRTIRHPFLLSSLALLILLPLTLKADPIEIDHFPMAVIKMELGTPGGGSELVTFKGPVEMQVFFEGASEGDAIDDDFNGRDEVSALFAELDMHGVSPGTGSLRLTLNPALPSMGLYEEVVNDTPGRLDVLPFTVGGQLDVAIPAYFTLEFVDMAGVTVHNVQDQPLRGAFHQKPPTYGDLLRSDMATEFYDDAGRPTGWWCRVIYCLLVPVVEKDSFDAVEVELELRDPSGTSETVIVDGQAGIHVIFEGSEEGDATDDEDDGRDEVDAEIVSLSLTGTSSYGAVHMTESAVAASAGEIEETVNHLPWWLDLPPFTPTTNDPASSFFDVYVDLTVGTENMRADDPCRITGAVTRKPAGSGDIFEGESFVPLIDASGSPTGWQMRINSIQLVPEPSAVGDNLPSLAGPTLTAAPNPFNPQIRLGFRGAKTGSATLKAFDARGRLVATLYEGPVTAEESFVHWDGRDAAGRMVASGPYFLRLETDTGTAGLRVLLAK